MKKLITALLSNAILTATPYASWSGTSIYLNVGPSIFNANFKENIHLEMPVTAKNSSFYLGATGYPLTREILLKIESDSVMGMNGALVGELNHEISDYFGVLGNVGLDFASGGEFNTMGSPHTFGTSISGGPFMFKDNVRIYGTVGISVSRSSFLGYPKTLQKLQNRENVSLNGASDYLNGNSAFAYTLSTGIDYKFSKLFSIGAFYTFSSAFDGTVTIEGNEFSTSLHSFGIRLGLHTD